MASKKDYILFDKDTQTFIYNMQTNAVQRMLDFDYVAGRKTPSVAAIVNPTGNDGFQKFFFGPIEILVPVYKSLKNAANRHKNVDVMINFASFRSAAASTEEAFAIPQMRTVVIIAEGVPERRMRELIVKAKQLNKVIIGPATVGGIVPGAFKIGNTGGTIENIMESKLHRPGSVGFVSKSGGLSNEAYNIVSQNTDGLYEGIAIGGDRYPGTILLYHLLRYEKNPEIKMLVCLGEVGGSDEYTIVDALKKKQITKPLVMWVTGTCSKAFKTEVQFGHAGAKAGSEAETADAKNAALKKAGAIVPTSYDDYDQKIKATYDALVKKGSGIGGVLSILWFKRQFPKYATKFIEMTIMVTADHGPAVSGAHNTIVAARAGKDLISSVASGMLTIGPRFGGAIDGAAQMFSLAYDRGLTPNQFVEEMKKKGENIQGIGHRVKSINNQASRGT